MSRVARLAAAVLVLSAASGTPAAHELAQAPRFRAGVELIQLDVSVLDRSRKPVAGLTESDFTILEDGKERPIRAFTPVRLPARDGMPPGPFADVRQDVATNHIGAQDGRLVIILMDRTIPLGEPTIAARRIAAAAVDALGPHDLAAVVSTSGGIPQNLTADRARLLRAIDQRDWSTGISKDAEAIPSMGKQDPLSDGRCLCGLCVLETVTRVSEALRDAPRRRKMLLFIGSSMIVQAPPRAPSADIGCEFRLRDARRALFDSLALSNLTVHSIDPGGLVNPGPQVRPGALGGQPGQNARSSGARHCRPKRPSIWTRRDRSACCPISPAAASS